MLWGMETEVWMHAVLGQTKFDIKSRQTFDDRGFMPSLGWAVCWTGQTAIPQKKMIQL